MEEVVYDNDIYRKPDSYESSYIAVKKNDCYGEVKKPTRSSFTFKSLEEKSSNKKRVAVLVLVLITLVLLLGAVAASTGYALFEITKIKTKISSSASLQQDADFTSKLNSVSQQMNASIEMLQQQLMMKLDLKIQQLQSSSSSTAVTLNSRISEVQNSSQNAVQQSVSMLQHQSFRNDSILDASIGIIADQIRDINNTLNSHCGGPGWRRVGYLDMTDPAQSCPSELALKNYSTELRSCGRASSSPGCWSTFYSTGGTQYSRVCGRVRGYQYQYTAAFHSSSASIDGNYVAGVSLTHGSSGHRTHIWTFAAGVTEVYDSESPSILCPCVTSSASPPPSFVGNDYFCESGLNTPIVNGQWKFYSDDPLWDGQNCVSSCCEFSNPPYFFKTLPAPTRNQIELRVCNQYADIYSDSPIDQLELYVQ